MACALALLRLRHGVRLWRLQADRFPRLPSANDVRSMNAPASSTAMPDMKLDSRLADDLWPILLDTARSSSTADLAHDALNWDAGLGWQLKGRWHSQAHELFDLFKPLLGVPPAGAAWVIAQLGQSLDGCVATRAGESSFINGSENLQHLHRLRAVCDAVIVGAGTVAADNPQLTTRRVPGPHPTRVLLDPQLGLAGHVESAHVFTDDQAPTLWMCDARWRQEAIAQVGADRVLAVSELLQDDATPNLAHAVKALQARGLRRLFVEGGGVTVSRFVAQRCLDRLHLAVAPIIIGNGRPGLRFEGPARLPDCQRPHCRVYRMGPDHLWDLDLRTGI